MTLRNRALLIYPLLLLGMVITLTPFLLSVLTAFKTPAQFASESPLALPSPWTLDNFAQLLGSRTTFLRSIWVTAAMTVTVTISQLVSSSLAAYAFAHIRFAGRELLFWVYLSAYMVPNMVLIVPLYLMMTELGLRNTFWSLVLPFMFASPYAIFLLREYFRGIPRDLIDAATLDGAGHWRILSTMILPLSKPILSTLALITVVSQWNSFLWPLVVTTGNKWGVITVATASLQSHYNGNWTLVMAGTTLAMLPLLVLFLIFQSNIVQSNSLTGVKLRKHTCVNIDKLATKRLGQLRQPHPRERTASCSAALPELPVPRHSGHCYSAAARNPAARMPPTAKQPSRSGSGTKP